jgi:hypothetical protein
MHHTAISASEELTDTFSLMVLLSGGIRQAENAVLDAIAHVCPGSASKRELILASAKSALAQTPEPEGSPDYPSPALPPELRRILRLPAKLRHCFVLRVLADCPSRSVLNSTFAMSTSA